MEISSPHLYWLTSVQSKNTGFPLVLSLKTENISPASHLIRPPRLNSKPHKPPVSQVRPSFLEQNSFVALFTHSSQAVFRQMRFYVHSRVLKKSYSEAEDVPLIKGFGARAERHLFRLPFFFFLLGDTE